MPKYPDSVIGRRQAAAELMGMLTRQEVVKAAEGERRNGSAPKKKAKTSRRSKS